MGSNQLRGAGACLYLRFCYRWGYVLALGVYLLLAGSAVAVALEVTARREAR